ncbi:hypothetical protein UFOVP916_32 [uncultured Caudovirales phage]|uniref:Uncharacterized protein n=1 Tax=uncultured Caudovirales phage TaxID=2100421 RepID=A0A6J5PQ36_9CAUD|nr:hypothetical protein UFOVP827_53 [uncultured Caudovirales phage]CAB4171461.1 hypothetical protein UFOVP916_32 [uncultured Caudovirales phage]CAB4177457.1 hypothetical protein UFOVP1001_56 [uncultured Caudovirales phage]CAB4199123.1 hypothetical protein UFOVP1338_20 [uncultured Caudovirales phage]CAB4213360.1 hypothetical protein UFOVP1447_15 [uncultured Caudovirales phage]
MKKQILTVGAMLISVCVFSQMQDSTTIQDEIKVTVNAVGGVAESFGIPPFITGVAAGLAATIGGWFIHRAIKKRKQK